MHSKAIEAGALAIFREQLLLDDDECRQAAQAAVAAYLAAMEAEGMVMASKLQIANLAQQIETLADENGTLKAIVRGWHYLAVGPDEMGDYYTQKQLIKASEPYASPALKALAARPNVK